MSDKQERPYIGVGVMVWREHQILLGKRINPNGGNSWQFPGGHLEFGETVSQCAEREVREEVGIIIKDLKPSGYTNDVFTMSGRHYVTLFVASNYDSGEVTVMEPGKCESWHWFDSQNLPTPLFAPISNFLKQHPDLSVLR